MTSLLPSKFSLRSLLLTTFLLSTVFTYAQRNSRFNVIAFYTGKNDQAHISFVHEANRWFSQAAKNHNFTYDSTSNWNNLNTAYLKKYQVILFLDSRPEDTAQRTAFENYMKNGGSWLGFHFAAFALTPSTYPQNWDWYHNEFLGSGQYKGNTWRPTKAVLTLENNHEVTKKIPTKFTASPNEWYSWENDLRKNKDISILYAIDSTSFPLGTGPKPHEIWHSGYYPVVWTNKNYRMIYINMGHNDIDYEHGTNKELSFTFENETQDSLIINCLKWLAQRK
jgi:hypothetical protein